MTGAGMLRWSGLICISAPNTIYFLKDSTKYFQVKQPNDHTGIIWGLRGSKIQQRYSSSTGKYMET